MGLSSIFTSWHICTSVWFVCLLFQVEKNLIQKFQICWLCLRSPLVKQKPCSLCLNPPWGCTGPLWDFIAFISGHVTNPRDAFLSRWVQILARPRVSGLQGSRISEAALDNGSLGAVFCLWHLAPLLLRCPTLISQLWQATPDPVLSSPSPQVSMCRWLCLIQQFLGLL